MTFETMLQYALDTQGRRCVCNVLASTKFIFVLVGLEWFSRYTRNTMWQISHDDCLLKVKV